MNVPSNWVSQARKAVKAWMGKSVTRSRVSSVRERNRARGRGEGCCLGSDRQENTRRGPSITFKDRRGVCTGVPRYPSGPQQHVAPLHGNYPADVSSLGRIGDSALGSPLPPVASHSFRAAGPVSSLPWRHCEPPSPPCWQVPTLPGLPADASAHLHREDLPQGEEEGVHVDVRVFAEAVGLGVVLEVHVVPPTGGGPLRKSRGVSVTAEGPPPSPPPPGSPALARVSESPSPCH